MVDDHLPMTDAGLVWSDARLLGFGPMDKTHQEFYDVTFKMLTCDASNVQTALADFESHARRHFGEEEEWMVSTAFPPRDCHIEEHAAVLKSVTDVREALEQRRATETLVHRLAMYLFDWFPGHAEYLDAALAAWMSKKAYGGQPVVLRRPTQVLATRRGGSALVDG